MVLVAHGRGLYWWHISVLAARLRSAPPPPEGRQLAKALDDLKSANS